MEIMVRMQDAMDTSVHSESFLRFLRKCTSNMFIFATDNGCVLLLCEPATSQLLPHKLLSI